MFDGKDLTRYPTYKRARLGLGRTFQRIELFAGMTVRDHLLVAERARLGTGRLWKDLLNLAQPTADERRSVSTARSSCSASTTSPTGRSSRSASGAGGSSSWAGR